MNTNDLFLWPDGYWCLRSEFSAGFLRPYNYRIVFHRSEEWRIITEKALFQIGH